ncbi:hypothetical protein JYU34_012303 [Plutella xylostella]|uniref:Ion transport domain-containing protein n=1 Tax=Plutella xylostella TaxID=51655 RepID=A0ABQ7QG24_PLUXY|nr:hypothetical protein JYU34_012303 [Plutella xylostella]
MEERIPLIRIQAEEGNSRASEEDNDGSDQNISSRVLSAATSREEDEDSSNNASSESKSPGQRTKSNQRWMKLRTTVQLSSAIQKKPPLKREDSFLKRFSTRQIPETQETVEDTGSEGAAGEPRHPRARRRRLRAPRSVVNPDENFYFYWLWLITLCVLYNLWTLIVRQSFPELQIMAHYFWVTCDGLSDAVFALDLVVQLRTGYLEQGLMVYDSKKLSLHYLRSRSFLLDLGALLPLDLLQLWLGTNPLIRFPRFLKDSKKLSLHYLRSRSFLLDLGALLPLDLLQLWLGTNPLIRFPRFLKDSKKLSLHYLRSRSFLLDLGALLPLDLLQLWLGTNPLIRFPRFLKVYRAVHCYYIVESRTVYPNFWRVINLIHILLILAHWFGCFYFLLSEAEGFQGDWVYPHRPGDYATLTRKYLGSLYWSTLTLTTIGDLPTPETNAETLGGPKFLPRRGLKSRLLQFKSNKGYVCETTSR